MALTINQEVVDGDKDRPVLLAKIENSNDRINAVISLIRDDGFICANDDKTIKVWLKRDSGQYWPSICHALAATPNSIDYNQETGRLFVGLENGVAIEFEVSDDFNKLTHIRDTYAHSSGITCVLFSLHCEWLLSCGKDKNFVWHCSESGRRIASYACEAWCTSIQFDSAARYAFVGDYGGKILVLNLQENGCKLVNKLTGHAGSIRTLKWVAEEQLLFSGSSDQAVICWDIGGKKGTAYELQGHKNKLVGLAFVRGKQVLISGSDDGHVMFWKMDVKRTETPSWIESNNCERCQTPFFWNVKEMWSRKLFGQRQHHCRMCGTAVCDKCSRHRSAIPQMGFEYSVRVCSACHLQLQGKDITSLARQFNSKHCIATLDFNETRQSLITVGCDKVIKIWDVSNQLGE